ncbi:uncharacterized protein B0H64DRAFT_390010 [Chaetomium fimeti]|uniref:F-box domain-containing protein n=1 Tax=Chaetomium fimeti TaxID=1854472 RepID=A0AAE0LSZ9_9PEZI|nr:hypothetical protein B0H64DRAFT_390010 [Chaetomium fimeti]
MIFSAKATIQESRRSRFTQLYYSFHFILSIFDTMGINNLAVELIGQIIQPLCLYCTPEPREDAGEDSDRRLNHAEKARFSSLASLCLVSRWLNATATPHLYHYLIDRNWPLLACTLLARADLAQTVKALWFHHYSDADKSQSSPEVAAYFAKELQAYQDGVSDERRNEIRMWEMPDLANMFSTLYSTPLDMVASLCPNLEAVDITPAVYDLFIFNRPNSLPRLRAAAFRHWDTEGAIGPQSLLPFFHAAPNLTTITFHRANDYDGLAAPLAQLTHLDFRRSAFGAETLAGFLASCPRLESFKYECGGANVGYGQFTLAEARDAVLARAAASLALFRLSVADDDVSVEEWEEAELLEMTRRLAERGIRFQFSWENMNGVE